MQQELNKIIWKCWERNAMVNPQGDAIVHWIAGKEPFRWSFAALLRRAKKYAVLLKDSGIKKDEVCAIIIRHHPEFYPLYMGVSLLGAIPAVLAYPNPRLHPEKFRQGIEGMSQRSGLDWIITEKTLTEILKPLVERKESTIRGIHLPLEENMDQLNDDEFSFRENIDEKDPFLLQHSSGTTGLQKPVLISHKALAEHAVSYGEALKVSAEDKVVSWLPLYHDMGLIASFHLPMLWGIPSVQIDPFEFIIAPEIMLQAVSQEKATLSWMPNFAFSFMADKIQYEDIENVSLSSIRMLINSSEPIRKNSIEKFVNKYTRFGFKPEAISTLYGMAETTMAVTQTCAGTTPVILNADRNKLAEGIFEVTHNEDKARACVSSGKHIRGCEIKIVDDTGKRLPPGRVGELTIRSISLFDGYRNYPEKTAGVMHEGWYYTGDIGFVVDDEYFVIGRKKDIIISAGKNIYPEDVEEAVNLVPGITPGRVVAFGEEDEILGTELISVIAETFIEGVKEKEELRLNILKAGMGIDVTVSNVYLVPPRWLIKSSAGKPGRKINKDRILELKNKNQIR